MRTSTSAVLLFCISAITFQCRAQQFPVEIRQESTPYNRQSQRGSPISSVPDPSLGSDGRAPTPEHQAQNGLTTTAPTQFQFRSMISFGAVAAPATPSHLSSGRSLEQNLVSIGLPSGSTNTANGRVLAYILKTAQVGSPFLKQAVSFSFGSVISVPETTENGDLLGQDGRLHKEDYWLAEPHTVNGHDKSGYYFSPHARKVFAIQPGPISVIWKKAQFSTVKPADFETNPGGYSLESGNYYSLFRTNYVVSGTAVKTPRLMFWTEGAFRGTGKPITVPKERVSTVNVVYHDAFPPRVNEEFSMLGQSHVISDSAKRLQELRTLWFDHVQGHIFAYNWEGRVFVELLGDSQANGQTHRHLGFEIVDVHQQPNPNDITVELGERLAGFADGRNDSDLFPEPIDQLRGAAFYYRQHNSQSEPAELYAVRETTNLNDLLVHWMETGEAGLLWPRILARYNLAWPADAGKYSHYLRPPVATDTEARRTAVHLPNENVPQIVYQDPLDTPRARLTEQFQFYTFLTPEYPAHRALLKFISGEFVSFERVFSWLDTSLSSRQDQFHGSVATNLTAWSAVEQKLEFPTVLAGPRSANDVVALVGDRILAPSGEAGSGPAEDYLAGFILQSQGTAFNANAYVDPFKAGFAAANRGAIIPVNALPGNDLLEVWWFRRNHPNLDRGFQPVFWPSVVVRYTLQWPSNAPEIVLASNEGSGPLESLRAKGRIFTQNDPKLPGYNPNEEHALMLGGQAFALRDDLNVTSGNNPSSRPFVLLEYTAADGRPAMTAFKVVREKPEEGIVFDYIVEAGSLLQAPMPLPELPKPVEGSGPGIIDYNHEPEADHGDLPGNWDESKHGTGPYAHFKRFTFRDRKAEHWVYRGLHDGLPELAAGLYDPQSKGFSQSLAATAVAGQDFEFTLHASRRAKGLLMTADSLPAWLRVEGISLKGRPPAEQTGVVTIQLSVNDNSDDSEVRVTLNLTVSATGSVITQKPLSITSSNPFSNGDVTYVGRPPALAASPIPANSFTMRFYYKTQEGFAWPGLDDPPAVGSIVPYLRKPASGGGFEGDPASKLTSSLDIVYRPVWPFSTPKIDLSETLTTAKKGLPSVRGQSSLQILYQQSIAEDIEAARPSVVLHDPTREKSCDITLQGLSKIPAGVKTDSFQGLTFFPELPPHLTQRFFFDPNRGELLFKGEFKDQSLGENYLLLNVLRGADSNSDLVLVKQLCPSDDPDKAAWDKSIDRLSTLVETFREDPRSPGTFIPDTALTRDVGIQDLAEIHDSDIAVDSYALSASGPKTGFVTLIAGNGYAFTPLGEPVSMHIMRVDKELFLGEVEAIVSPNPLNEEVTFQHTADLAGRFDQFEYEWRRAAPVDGSSPPLSQFQLLKSGTNLPRVTLGDSGVLSLQDNFIIMRYRPKDPTHPLFDQWSDWTKPAFAEGWIKRVLAGINPFNQRVTDLFDKRVNTDASILTEAGPRWEGDVALNLENIDDFGLIEIYETVLNRGIGLSIGDGINFGPVNDALLLAAGYLNDLYMLLGNEAWADAANPTIGIGTKDRAFGDIATSLFAFRGQVPSLLEEELALLRGRDDFAQPGVEVTPVYNRLFWNYTRGIDAGEVIYALNYDIQEKTDTRDKAVVDAEDARHMFPQGHGDAYGHFLTALKVYYSLLSDKNFDWVPRIESVNVLGKPVQVDYTDERKLAAAAAAVARTGLQIFDLTWRKDYRSGSGLGWEHFAPVRTNLSRKLTAPGGVKAVERHWGLDAWASRTGQGAYLNWVVVNSLLPDIDPDPAHEGIQRIDRTTVPELGELVAIAENLNTSMDSAEAGANPLGLPESSVAFDINPQRVVGLDPQTHFEQIYDRALATLNNAVAAFDDAKDITQLMRSETDSVADLQADVLQQELAFADALIEIYGTPYPDDIGPGKTYKSGYTGPDLVHFSYVDIPELILPKVLGAREGRAFRIDIQRSRPLPSLPVSHVGYGDYSPNYPRELPSASLPNETVSVPGATVSVPGGNISVPGAGVTGPNASVPGLNAGVSAPNANVSAPSASISALSTNFSVPNPNFLDRAEQISALNPAFSFRLSPPFDVASIAEPVLNKIEGDLRKLLGLNVELPPIEFQEVPGNHPKYQEGTHYVEYYLSPLGFFEKPPEWKSRRRTSGTIQQAIADLFKAHANLEEALNDTVNAKKELDYAMSLLFAKRWTHDFISTLNTGKTAADVIASAANLANKISQGIFKGAEDAIQGSVQAAIEALPKNLIGGTAVGGDETSPPRSAFEEERTVSILILKALGIGFDVVNGVFQKGIELGGVAIDDLIIQPALMDQEMRKDVEQLFIAAHRLENSLPIMNRRLRELDDAHRNFLKQKYEGERIQNERDIFRNRAAALVQGFRTRDAAFRIFRNEKLERYKTLYDLAARYAYLAAQAYDYETGLLHTQNGREFIRRIVNSRALGVVRQGEPQFAGSDTGDPGLSSVLAEMRADWEVLKGRLGFNNPDAYGTTVSLRSELFRILPGAEGDAAWRDQLENARRPDLLQDPDVRRYCMQIDEKDGLPVPGLLFTFGTTVAKGLNLFGNELAPGDSAFSSSSFATKLYAAGVAFEGYRGMANPNANSSAVNFAGGASPNDPNVTFLDPQALAATPYVYLIPTGLDSMRSPPLGDESVIRTWSVEDVTIPLPFNIGASGFSNKKFWQSADSLTEPLFNLRKHQAFRPVSSSGFFTGNVFGVTGSLQPTQFTNRRLIGRSVWNSSWKLIIPGHTLLRNPDEGLDRFSRTVKDIQLHFVTYSYSGN